jgi:xylulokinase
MKVYVSSTKEAAGMGGARLAKYAWWRVHCEGKGSFEEMTGGETPGLECVAEPRKHANEVYEKLVPVYSDCELQAVMMGASGL